MPRRFNRITDKGRQRQGRGIGAGPSYEAWIQLGDFRNDGVQTYYPCLKTGRLAHNLSDHEGAVRLLHITRPDVLDAQESYRLSLSATQLAARQLGVRHPRCYKTKSLQTMHIDLFLDVRLKNGLRGHEAHIVTTLKKLAVKRTLRDIRIIEKVLEQMNVRPQVWTENEVNSDLIDNYERLRVHDKLKFYPDIDVALIQRIEPELLKTLVGSRFPLAFDCQILDRRLKVKNKTCLTVVYHLIWHGIWRVDLTKKINPESEPLTILGRVVQSPRKLIQLGGS